MPSQRYQQRPRRSYVDQVPGGLLVRTDLIQDQY